jgi:hypothetical protein
MTAIQQRLTERYKGYRQKDLYQPKKDILKDILNNDDEYLRTEYSADLHELRRYHSELK